MIDGEIRLDRLIRSWGYASKRQVSALVSEGRISLNGAAVTAGSVMCLPGDTIAIDGNILVPRAPVTLMMNKPKGYVCVYGDARYPSIFTLLEPEYADCALFPIGRLDADTEGLLLLTNDGELSEKTARPEAGIKKTYFLTTDRPIPQCAENILRSGVTLTGGAVCAPAELKRMGEREAYLTISEGKYHEVKRLIRAAGARVKSLKRVSIGSLRLDPALPSGAARPLTDDEIRLIFE